MKSGTQLSELGLCSGGSHMARMEQGVCTPTGGKYVSDLMIDVFPSKVWIIY